MALDIAKVKDKIVNARQGKGVFKSRKFYIILVAALVFALFVLRPLIGKGNTKAVEVETIARKDIVRSLSVTGSIEANATDRKVLGVSQKVVDVHVREGQDVSEGDPLVVLDTSDLEYQLQKAQINLNAALSNEGGGLKSAQDAVSQAAMNLEKARGDYDQVKRKFDLNQELYGKGYISREEYESSLKSLNDMNRQVKLMEMQLESAQRSLDNYDSSQIRQQINQYSADVDNLNKKIEDSTIKAVIGGRVVRLDAAKGEYPRADRNIVMVCDISSYKLVTSVSQYDAVMLEAGQKAEITVKGIDRHYTGVITKVGEIADVSAGSTSQDAKIDIEITLDSADSQVKIGYEADGDIILSRQEGVIAVNYDSIRQDSGGKYVYCVQQDRVVKKYIVTGMETEFDVVVTEGLDEGDVYIPSPPEGIRIGDRVDLS